MKNIYQDLFGKDLITEKQILFLESIRTNKIVSVYYELRTILYLGILLFSGGIGYIAYQNIGEIGHLLLMVLMALAILFGFYYISKHAKPYSNQEVEISHNYFDYILILVALLIIGLFGYVQVYYDLVEYFIRSSSFISSALFFFMAYRYDNKSLLAMAITAFSAALGLAITPVDWVKGDLVEVPNLYYIAIFLGIFLLVVGQFSEVLQIKKHFRFTYQNFGLLLFYIGLFFSLSDSYLEIFYAFLLLILISSVFLCFYTWYKKEFLFFLYSNLAAYISLTYLIIFQLLDDGFNDLLTFYFPITCIGYIVFLVKHKSHFSND